MTNISAISQPRIYPSPQGTCKITTLEYSASGDPSLKPTTSNEQKKFNPLPKDEKRVTVKFDIDLSGLVTEVCNNKGEFIYQLPQKVKTYSYIPENYEHNPGNTQRQTDVHPQAKLISGTFKRRGS